MPGDSKLRRLGVLALVLCIAAQPMAGVALASTTSNTADLGDCETTKGDLILDIVTGGIGDFIQYTDDDTCVSEDTLTNVSWTDHYEAAALAEDSQKSFLAAESNFVNYSQTHVRTLVKKEVIESHRNNESLSTAKSEVNATLDEYFSNVQKRVVKNHNTSLLHSYYVANASDPTDSDDYNWRVMALQNFAPDGNNDPYGDTASTGTWEFESESELETQGTSPKYTFNTSTDTVTLLNGNTTKVVTLTKYSDGSPYIVFNPWGAEQINPQDERDDAIIVGDPDLQGLTTVNFNSANASYMYWEQPYEALWNATVDKHNRVQSNAMSITEGVYNEYTADNFSGLEILDANDLVTQFNTERNSTGYYGWAAAMFGTTGVEGNTNASFAIEYDPVDRQYYDNGTVKTNITEPRNITGTLFTNWAPSKTNGSYLMNETYDTSNTNKPVYFAAQRNNSTEVIELNGNFTVQALTNAKTGDSLNETSLTPEYQQQTWNASLTKEEMLSIQEYRDTQNDIQPTGGGGGWFDFGGFDFTTSGIVLIAIAGGGLLLLTRS